MRVLTFNLWHGLSPSSPLAFEALEPTARRLMREDLQVEAIRSLNPDFCFLQEVNPVADRVESLRKALRMDAHFQADLVGLKVFGLGIPYNLHSGLAILGAERFGAKYVRAQSLSRPINWVRRWASWQLQEERFALFCESLIPEIGKVLLVNTHLHHGLQSTPELLAEVDKMADSFELNSSFVHELKERILKGDRRRRSELTSLLKTIESLDKRYSAVVLCGDFNATPESEVYKMLREAGFREAWGEMYGGSESAEQVIVNPNSSAAQSRNSLSANGDSIQTSFNLDSAENRSGQTTADYKGLESKSADIGSTSEGSIANPGYTFDKDKNSANHLLQARFPLSLVLEDLTFSQKTKDHLLQLARRQEARPRRIDYIWFRSRSLNLKVTRAELVGQPNAEGLAPSDHFGLCADLELG